MAETIEGGAYLSADKKTWHDAHGKPILPPTPEALNAAGNFEAPVDPEPALVAAPSVVAGKAKKAKGDTEA